MKYKPETLYSYQFKKSFIEEAKENTKVKRAELQLFTEPDENEAADMLAGYHTARAVWGDDPMEDPENFRPLTNSKADGH